MAGRTRHCGGKCNKIGGRFPPTRCNGHFNVCLHHSAPTERYRIHRKRVVFGQTQGFGRQVQRQFARQDAYRSLANFRRIVRFHFPRGGPIADERCCRRFIVVVVVVMVMITSSPPCHCGIDVVERELLQIVRTTLRQSVRQIRSRLLMDNIYNNRRVVVCSQRPSRKSTAFVHSSRGCYDSMVSLPQLSPMDKEPTLRIFAARPDMTTLDSRLQSFEKSWNMKFPIAHEMLASHGFFRVISENLYDDTTQCFYCEARFSNWTMSDVPIREHRRLWPKCYYGVALHDLLRRQNGLMYKSLSRFVFVRVLIPDKRRKSVINTLERAYGDSNVRECSFRQGRYGER